MSDPTSSQTKRRDTKDKSDTVREVPQKHQSEKQQLLNEYKKLYRYWHFQLTEGFNLLFYGIGSKKFLLEDFAQQMFTDGPTIIVQGYFPHLNIQTVLSAITERVLHLPLKFTEVNEHLECIKSIFHDVEKEQRKKRKKKKIKKNVMKSSSPQCKVESEDQHSEKPTRRLSQSVLRALQVPQALYLLIHNIDALAVRFPSTQHIFASLATIRRIHVVASFDHHQTPLLWDQFLLSQFNWIYHHVPTFERYQQETAFEGQLSDTFSVKGTLEGRRGALSVLRTLPPKTTQIFLILAQFLLQHPQLVGLSADEYYEMCSEKFLVTSRALFNSVLNEFKDHKLIQIKRGSDGQLYYSTPLHPNLLKQILQEFGSQLE